MKLALYLPNFRNKVTVKELEDLTSLAEELDFDSVWTLDRIVVPEASDRQELQYSFGMMAEFPKALPVSSRGEWFQGMPLIPWLAAKTTKVRIGMSITDTPYRAPGVLAAELATVDHLSNGRVNVGVGSGWMPEEFAAASASHIFPKRHQHVRETIEIMQGIWTNDLFEYHGEFADFERCGFGAKPVQKPHPPIFFSGLKDPKRSANRIAKYGLSGWIGIQDTPDELKQWRGAIQRELEELGSSRSVDDLEICSMIWFVITDAETDQTLMLEFLNYNTSGAASFAPIAEGRKWQYNALKYPEVYNFIGGLRERKQYLQPYWLTLDKGWSTMVSTSGSRTTELLTCTGDITLILFNVYATAIGTDGNVNDTVLVQFSDAKTMRSMQSQPMPLNTCTGTAQNPMRLASPWIIEPQTQIKADFTNNSGVACKVYLTFHGVAIYTGSSFHGSTLTNENLRREAAKMYEAMSTPQIRAAEAQG
jgi:alkanesulfonate monooxygenase SsuD/methylene tetrahydromethanopterin reductase-like flavin-dependent oxidoreductase (luciferase family)